MEHLVLVSGPKEPILLRNLELGHEAPVMSLSWDGAFGKALSRRGWVAVKVQYRVGSVLDGHLDQPEELPRAWQMLPAADDDLLLLIRYFGRSGRSGEHSTVVVVDARGQVCRTQVLPWQHDGAPVVGEVGAGVVTWAGIADWNDSATDLPVTRTDDPLTEPRPFAVLAGRVILFEAVDYVESVDTVTGARHRLAIPHAPRRGPYASRFPNYGVSYNEDATWLWAKDQTGGAMTPLGGLVAGVEGQLRYLPRDADCGPWFQTLWITDKLLIADHGQPIYDPVQDESSTTTSRYYDPSVDTLSVADIVPIPSETGLRLDVTGRFGWPP